MADTLEQMGGEQVGSLESQPYEKNVEPEDCPSPIDFTNGGPATNNNQMTQGLLDPDEAPYVTPGVTEFAVEAEDVKIATNQPK
jgi:hypothetical protein